ncbi:serine endoprotease [compost metagenome]
MLIERSAGPSAKAGIQPGDVLLSLNGVPVHNIGEVKEALSKAGKTVALLVQRGEDKIFVPVQVG